MSSHVYNLRQVIFFLFENVSVTCVQWKYRVWLTQLFKTTDTRRRKQKYKFVSSTEDPRFRTFFVWSQQTYEIFKLYCNLYFTDEIKGWKLEYCSLRETKNDISTPDWISNFLNLYQMKKITYVIIFILKIWTRFPFVKTIYRCIINSSSISLIRAQWRLNWIALTWRFGYAILIQPPCYRSFGLYAHACITRWQQQFIIVFFDTRMNKSKN